MTATGLAAAWFAPAGPAHEFHPYDALFPSILCQHARGERHRPGPGARRSRGSGAGCSECLGHRFVARAAHEGALCASRSDGYASREHHSRLSGSHSGRRAHDRARRAAHGRRRRGADARRHGRSHDRRPWQGGEPHARAAPGTRRGREKRSALRRHPHSHVCPGSGGDAPQRLAQCPPQRPARHWRRRRQSAAAVPPRAASLPRRPKPKPRRPSPPISRSAT